MISDILTEFYGKYYASLAVRLFLLNGISIALLIGLSRILHAIDRSVVNDVDFNLVFNLFDSSVLASSICLYVY